MNVLFRIGCFVSGGGWYIDWPRLGWRLAAVFGTIAMLIVVVVFVALEHDEWARFASQHNCRIVARSSGSFSSGVSVSSSGRPGVVSVYNDGQVGYLCDDGVTYWRSN